MSEQPFASTSPSLAETAGAFATPASDMPATSRAGRRWRLWLGVTAAVVGVGAVLGVVMLGSLGRHKAHARPGNGSNGDAATLSVNTVIPQRKTLLRTLEQPGSIEPSAQAELYAKVSGYLKRIARDPAPGTNNKGLPASAASFPTGPQKDIGSLVKSGEVIMEIDVPELAQDVIQKESLLKQSQTELAAARTSLATFQAAIKAAEAQVAQADADIEKYQSETVLRSKQLQRYKELAKDRTVAAELVDERQDQLNAATAALESSKAKLKVANAELTVATSKLATAQADVSVRESRVQVARDELERARVLADYANIRAPFEGLISARNVDEGDFIQNASTSQSRPLMTVTAVDKVKIVLQIQEREAVAVQPGTPATIHVDAIEGWQFSGVVTRVNPTLDAQLRTRRVEIDVDNKNHKLMPGMYGQVVLTLQKLENAQAIPATAVYSRKGENYLIQVENGVARRHPIHIRYDDGTQLEVVKTTEHGEVPLKGDEELVVSNKGEIADGQRVKASRLPAP
jgi:HlyD family secretion protein